jgi:hypothetical protein
VLETQRNGVLAWEHAIVTSNRPGKSLSQPSPSRKSFTFEKGLDFALHIARMMMNVFSYAAKRTDSKKRLKIYDSDEQGSTEGRGDVRICRRNLKKVSTSHRKTAGPEGFEPPLSGSEGRRLDPD